MSKREVKMTDWCLGFRKIATGFIVCLEGTPTDSKQIWSSSVVKNFIDKGIIETKNTKYAVQGMPREYYTIRSKDKLGRHIFLDQDGTKVGTAYNFGSKVWFFKSKYYPTLWACQVAADLLVLRKKVKILNT